MAEIQLHHWDYDKNKRVEDGTVSTHQIAKCIDPETLVELLDDFLNYAGRGYGTGITVGKGLRTHHRTLQRSAVAFALGLIVGISDQKFTDPRNAQAIETAKYIGKLVGEGKLPLGPYL
jgi:hypothetical protein